MYEVKYTLKEEEYLEFLKYNLSMSKSYRNRGYWLKYSLPALILITLYYFKVYDQILLNVCAFAFIFIWIFFISNRLWLSMLDKAINEAFLKKSKINTNQTIILKIDEDKVIVNDQSILFDEIQSVRPLHNILVLYHNNEGVFVIPNRIIEACDDKKQFKFIIER